MDLWQRTNWFVIQAKPYQENLAAAQVAKFDAEVFLPINQFNVLRTVRKTRYARSVPEF